MGDNSEAEHVPEMLVGIRRMAEDDEDGPGPEFHPVRELTQEESAASCEASGLLKSLSDDAPLLLFSEVRDEFMRDILKLEAAEDGKEFSIISRRLHRSYKSLLSELRSFDDHTSHWISTTFGRDHPAFAEFKAALSEEYDNNFAYRLHATLRNVSEHIGSRLLNNVRFLSGLHPDRSVWTETVIHQNAHRLAMDFPLKSSIQLELLALDDVDLEVEWMTRATFVSCERAYSRLLIALESKIRPAADLVKSLHQEGIEGGGASTWFVPAETFTREFSESGRNIVIRDNEHWNAFNILTNLDQARSVVSKPPLLMGPADFIALVPGRLTAPPHA